MHQISAIDYNNESLGLQLKITFYYWEQQLQFFFPPL
jgi:hypothetical protein